MRSIYCFLLLFASLTNAVGQEVEVPNSKSPVLLDGKFSENEWQEARMVIVNDSLMLYIKQDAEYLYWCLRNKNKNPSLIGVDFYLSHQAGLINLHASAKLGERTFNNGTYGEWFWWNNRDWTANVARFNSFEGQRFLKDEAKEFQLRKSRFALPSLRMMFQLEQPAKPPAFPLGSEPEDTQKWLILKLS